MIEFGITHTDEGLKTLYHDWWKRLHGLSNAWATGMLLFCFLVMFLTRSAAWYLVVPAVMSACFLGLVQAIRYQATKSALAAFVEAGRPALSYQFDQAGLVETSAMGRVELPWTRFTGLARIGRCWVLYRGRLADAQFIAFPEHQIPLEALDFVRQRLALLAQATRSARAPG